MKTPITYYGGKQRMVNYLLNIIPKHRMYVEPYFGGGSVYFAKEPSKIEVINDKNQRLINFYKVLQSNFKDLRNMIQSTPHSEYLHSIAKDIYNNRIESTPLEQAWSVWLISHTSFNSSFHGGWKWCNGTNGADVAKVLENKRNDINKDLFERISTTQISCRDALRVIKDRDHEDTFFYLDPPYPGAHQGHYSGYTMSEFIDLLELLSSIKGKFILSNYWSQNLRKYIKDNGWDYDKKIMHLGTNVNSDRIRNQNRKKTKKEEIIVANFHILHQSIQNSTVQTELF
jgi:DNA adenine methylase